jgi:hypothetical protein
MAGFFVNPRSGRPLLSAERYVHFSQKRSNGFYKRGLIHRRELYRSFDAVEFATLTWVPWFNNRRLLQPIGTIPLVEVGERCNAILDEPAMAA